MKPSHSQQHRKQITGMNLSKERKDQCDENCKICQKKLQKTSSWKDTSCLWIRRDNTDETTTLPKAVSRFSAVPIETPETLFTETEQSSDSGRTTEGPAQSGKNKTGVLVLLGFHLCYKVSNKNRHVCRQDRLEVPELCDQLTFQPGIQEDPPGKGKPLQQMVLGKLDTHTEQ